VSVTAGVMTAKRDARNAAIQFRAIAENHFLILQSGLNEYLGRLAAVRALFNSSEDVITRQKFEEFTQPLLVYSSGIVTMSWVPRILGPARSAHERLGASQGIKDYRIKWRLSDNKTMVTAPERSEYYPIFYATLPKASPLYGLDLFSEPPTRAELEQARDTGQLGFSPIHSLVSTGETGVGYLFSLPIYRHGLPHDTVEDRRRNIVGFVHGSILTAKLIDTIIATTISPTGLDLFFFDPHASPKTQPLYLHPSPLQTQPIAALTQADLSSSQHWSRTLMAAGQPWLTMVARPTPGGPLTVTDDRPWIVTSSFLVITLLVTVYLWASGQHALRMIVANKRVSDLARTDALTSLANRRVFVERLNEAFAACRRGAKPIAVLYFDLDHFKDINDTLGHPVGDALLRQVANRVTGATRETDVVARFGGDEFAILQSDANDLSAAGALAAKIAKILAEPYLIDGNEVHITPSIGIARYTSETSGPDAMMIQADLALYRAKEEGRNCFRFHSADLDRQVQERVTIADELRGALERSELELYYQPQVELRSGQIIGLEALLRWNHPVRGQISPAVFIPVAERSGQIQVLGQWVLDAACRQLRTWLDQRIAPQLVGVNFSALHFKGSPELDCDVAASLNRCSIAPQAIEIELTESMLMDITEQHNDRFEKLRQLGLRIAIDDFGTGYSSLNYLANYPINRVKIAQELVAGADSDSRSAAVVRAAIRLGHELGIEVIAEGVETEGQAQFLLSAGCEHAQGFYFSRPVNAEEATALLRAGWIKPIRGPLRLVKSTAA